MKKVYNKSHFAYERSDYICQINYLMNMQQ